MGFCFKWAIPPYPFCRLVGWVLRAVNIPRSSMFKIINFINADFSQNFILFKRDYAHATSIKVLWIVVAGVKSTKIITLKDSTFSLLYLSIFVYSSMWCILICTKIVLSLGENIFLFHIQTTIYVCMLPSYVNIIVKEF